MDVVKAKEKQTKSAKLSVKTTWRFLRAALQQAGDNDDDIK